ncbi:MAG: transglycosylase [Brachymonas sp.]|nr:transglycosylase [Brachymonas sp.]
MDFGLTAGGQRRPRGLINYANVPHTIAAVVSARLATLHELQTVYGLMDLWDLIEIHAVDSHNQVVMQKENEL